MAGGVFPNFRSDEKAEKQSANGETVTAYDEERRLAYVAITRGELTTTVLSPKNSYLGKAATASIFPLEACIPFEGEAEQEKETQQNKTASLVQDAIRNLRNLAEEGAQ
jgi:superfamily I DNA/RNA helicase